MKTERRKWKEDQVGTGRHFGTEFLKGPWDLNSVTLFVPLQGDQLFWVSQAFLGFNNKSLLFYGTCPRKTRMFVILP